MDRHLRREERHLEREAKRAARHGNIGAAVTLHSEAVAIHNTRVANRILRRCTWGATHHIIRRIALQRAIARRVVIPLAFATSLTDVMIIYDAAHNGYRLADESDPAPCIFDRHAIIELPEYTEVCLQDPMNPGHNRILYADSYCRICGQHFFIEPPTMPTVYSNPPPYPSAVPPIPYNPPPLQQQAPMPTPQYYPPNTTTTAMNPYPGTVTPPPTIYPSSVAPPPYSNSGSFYSQPPVSSAPAMVVPSAPTMVNCKFCGACGRELKATDKFCTGCGRQV